MNKKESVNQSVHTYEYENLNSETWKYVNHYYWRRWNNKDSIVQI
jgi:hypothetical protein